jgi:putative ABC transport system permease protein
MRLRNIVLLYRVRLRTRVVQELFAAAGIAVGVALLFASQVASTSLDGSVGQLTSGIIGQTRLQIEARGTQGFTQGMLGEVQRLPGVRSVAPLLEERANLIGPSGQRLVDLYGADPRFSHLGGSLLRHFTATQLAGQKAFALPLPIAESVGLSSLQVAEFQIGARTVQAFLGAVLLESDIGPLVHSPIAIAPLAYVQQLAGMPGRLTRIFVQPDPGRDPQVRDELTRLVAGRLDVRPADFEAKIFRQAAGPVNQSALLFSAISALVGFLFAFNAMLLTVPERRHLVEDLRLDGYARRMIVEVLLFDALVLGIFASLLGLALGDLLSLVLFQANPGYLSFAFPVGSQRIITWQSLAIAVSGGLLAACVGVLAPLKSDICSRLALGRPTPRFVRGASSAAPLAGVACLAVTTLILLLAPQDAIVGIVSLLVAMLLLLPLLIHGIVFLFDRLQRSVKSAAPSLAVVELKSSANQARSLAIAATGAVAVFGSVAIQGAHANLQHGLDHSAHDVTAIADLWVVSPGPQNLLATTPFHATAVDTLAHLPGVRSVRLYRGGFLDFGDRRIWVFAPALASSQLIPPSQMVRGDLALATARLRRGHWAVISQAIAAEDHLGIGQSFVLPSPRPTVFRVAGESTNIGWSPGAIILNAKDYAQAWGSTDPSAYNILLARGASSVKVSKEVRLALGSRSGLAVETSGQREQRQRMSSRQGLSRLTEISVLVLIAAVLAMAAAMGAMIWQRRSLLADMKVDGFGRNVLWRALLAESTLLLGTGCSIGAVFGLYGQLLLSHALATVTGFPVVYSVGALVAIGSFALVTGVAVAILAVPGYLVARVRPAIILQD